MSRWEEKGYMLKVTYSGRVRAACRMHSSRNGSRRRYLSGKEGAEKEDIRDAMGVYLRSIEGKRIIYICSRSSFLDLRLLIVFEIPITPPMFYCCNDCRASLSSYTVNIDVIVA